MNRVEIKWVTFKVGQQKAEIQSQRIHNTLSVTTGGKVIWNCIGNTLDSSAVPRKSEE